MYPPELSPIGSRRIRSYENNGNPEMSHLYEASSTNDIPQMNNIEKGISFSGINFGEELFVKLLHKYVMSYEELWKLRYRPIISSYGRAVLKLKNRTITFLKQSVDTDGKVFVSKNELVNELQRCYRCQHLFHIAEERYVKEGKCYYHWGKIKQVIHPEDKRYKREFYECCQKGKRSIGCTEGRLHVWTGHDFDYDGFICTKSRQNPTVGSTNKCFALDCEMSFTVKGLELTKVSIVDMRGVLVYNAYVKPDFEIVDFNTRFSGITAENMYNGPTKSIREVQNDLMEFIDKDTILIGHGLENDMRALKIVHNKLVDTSHAFPHHRGLPYRRSLKELASTILKRTIQCGSAGHDSYEDAISCMELMLWRVGKDYSSRMQNL